MSDDRGRKAVSTMIATLILIGVTAAMGSFIYWYAMSYAKSTSKVFAIAVTELKMSKTATGLTSFLLSLRNQGTTVVELTNVTIYDDSSNPVDVLKYGGKVSIFPPLVDGKVILSPGTSVTVVYVGQLTLLSATLMLCSWRLIKERSKPLLSAHPLIRGSQR